MGKFCRYAPHFIGLLIAVVIVAAPFCNGMLFSKIKRLLGQADGHSFFVTQPNSFRGLVSKHSGHYYLPKPIQLKSNYFFSDLLAVRLYLFNRRHILQSQNGALASLVYCNSKSNPDESIYIVDFRMSPKAYTAFLRLARDPDLSSAVELTPDQFDVVSKVECDEK